MAISRTPTRIDMLREAARSTAEVGSAHAVESDDQRRLAHPVVLAAREGGLQTLCLPETYGGPGIGLPEFAELLTTVAIGDGAAGWCCMIGSTSSSLAAFMHRDAAAEVFPSPQVSTAGVFAPNGKAIVGDGAVTVTGRWAWGSGSHDASFISGGAIGDDGKMRVCWYPASDVTLHDTWHTVGLRGTGSGDFSVDNAVVPNRLVIQPTTGPAVDEPMAQFPNFTLLAVGVAAVALGIGRHALDELIAIADNKTPQYSSRVLAESPFTQIELARAEARWRAAAAYLSGELDRAWEVAARGDRVGVADRVGIRLAAAHAAIEARTVADTAWTLAGGTAVSDTGVLGRCMRDSHMVTQHIMVAPKIAETLGKYLVGAEFRDTMI